MKVRYSIFARFFFLSFIFFNFINAQSEGLYSKLALQALKPYSDLKKENSNIEMEDENVDTNKPKYKLEVEDLSDFDKREIVFKLLECFGDEHKREENNVFLEEYWSDLEFFCGSCSNSRMSLFSQLNLTKTIFGEIVLQKMLTQPLVDVDQIKRRQDVIKRLLTKQELFEEIKNQLKRFGQAEPITLTFWKKENPFNEEIFKRVYFTLPGLRNLNQNALALELNTRFDNFINLGFEVLVIPFIVDLSLAGFVQKWEWEKLYPNGEEFVTLDNPNDAKYKKIKEEFKKRNNVFSYYDPISKKRYVEGYYTNCKTGEFMTTYSERNPFPEDVVPVFFSAMLNAFKYIPKFCETYIDYLKDEKVSSTEKVANSVLISVFALVGTFLAYHGISTTIFKANIAKYLQKRLIAVATAFNSIKNVRYLLENDKILRKSFDFKYLDELENKKDKLTKLLGLLSTNTFKGKESFFSFTGRVLAAYKLMAEVKNGLIKIFECLGEVDAYCSIADLMRNFESEKVKYCFVDLKKSDYPILKIEDFWFPSLLNKLNPENIITNSIELGGTVNGIKNILLTGPNTGGKSTILKGLITGIVLAQSFGIAPAKKMEITPFKKIQTYLNIVDNSAEGISLFKAELIRAKKLLNTLNTLQVDEFSFTVFDEVFNGTNPEEAIQGSSYIAASFAEHKNSISIIATHFGILTDLEKVTDGAYKNYKVSVIKNPDGSFKFPYTWEPGISDQHIALDLMKQEKLDNPVGLSVAQKFAEKIQVSGVR